jgi:hypothetical protein
MGFTAEQRAARRATWTPLETVEVPIADVRAGDWLTKVQIPAGVHGTLALDRKRVVTTLTFGEGARVAAVEPSKKLAAGWTTLKVAGFPDNDFAPVVVATVRRAV